MQQLMELFRGIYGPEGQSKRQDKMIFSGKNRKFFDDHGISYREANPDETDQALTYEEYQRKLDQEDAYKLMTGIDLSSGRMFEAPIVMANYMPLVTTEIVDGSNPLRGNVHHGQILGDLDSGKPQVYPNWSASDDAFQIKLQVDDAGSIQETD